MAVEMARLQKLDAQGQPQAGEDPIIAHFNPQSLQLSYRTPGPKSSTRSAAGSSTGGRTGVTSQRTGYTVSLASLELLFDTSEQTTDRDVRNITLRIARLIQADDESSATNVQFSWGTFIFRGIITTLDETLDYFSEDGIPLRATVRLGMDMNEVERESNRSSGNSGAGAAAGIGASAGIAASAGIGAGVSAGFGAGISGGIGGGISAGVSAGVAVGTTPLTFAQSGESLQSLAGRAGVDWKATATANNIDNPRQIQAGTVIDLKAGANVKVGS